MANIFISYAKEDAETAEKIYDSLVSEGHSVWMDSKMLIPGQDWETEIEKAIRNSDIFVACLSTHSVNKIGFVQAELRKAMKVAELMPEGRIFIIPVRMDQCEVPFSLRHLQWVNYFEMDSGDSLLRAVRSQSNVEKELEDSITEFLLRSRPEELTDRFRGVSSSKLTKALIKIAQKTDELTSVRKRAVRGLSILEVLDADAWTAILPTASTELLQDWIATWGEDEDETILTEEHIRMLCEARNLPRSSKGFGKAVRKFIERGAEYTSAVLLPASTYPSWEVKLDCVKTIILLDDTDSVKTLDAFSTMSYFVARMNIIEYLETKIDAGELSREELQIALGIANRFVNDGKTRPKTTTMRKSKQLLAKLMKVSASHG
jgi:hypothetical protein